MPHLLNPCCIAHGKGAFTRNTGIGSAITNLAAIILPMIIIEPNSKQFDVVNRNESPTEFEVQSFLYSELKRLGFNVRGELVHFDKKKRQKCRFDLVIFDKNNKAKVIIEVKSAPVKHKTRLEDTRQYQKYTSFGCRVAFVYGMSDAEDYVNSLDINCSAI